MTTDDGGGLASPFIGDDYKSFTLMFACLWPFFIMNGCSKFLGAWNHGIPLNLLGPGNINSCNGLCWFELALNSIWSSNSLLQFEMAPLLIGNATWNTGVDFGPIAWNFFTGAVSTSSLPVPGA